MYRLLLRRSKYAQSAEIATWKYLEVPQGTPRCLEVEVIRCMLVASVLGGAEIATWNRHSIRPAPCLPRATG